MKKRDLITGWCILLVVLLLGSGFQTTGERAKTIRLSRPGQAYTLEVTNGQGSVTVEAYNGKGVNVSADRRPPGADDKAEQGNVYPDQDFIITEHDNQVSIRAKDPEHLNNIRLQVPAGASSIKLATHNKGNITVSNISAPLEINHLNGNISLQHVAGPVVASTLNGRIEASFSHTDANTAMAFSNLNGDIDLLFPADFHANVRLKVAKGEIIFRYFNATGYHLDKADNSQWTTGQIGGGGPELMVSCGRGNIIIKKQR